MSAATCVSSGATRDASVSVSARATAASASSARAASSSASRFASVSLSSPTLAYRRDASLSARIFSLNFCCSAARSFFSSAATVSAAALDAAAPASAAASFWRNARTSARSFFAALRASSPSRSFSVSRSSRALFSSASFSSLETSLESSPERGEREEGSGDVWTASSLATSPSVPETPLICAATSLRPHADRRSRSSRIAFTSNGLPVTIARVESFSISRSSLVTSVAARETSRHSPTDSRYPPAAPVDGPPASAAPPPARLDRSISDAARATRRPVASRAYPAPPVSNARISATSASTSAWTRAMTSSGTARAPRALRSARRAPRRSLRRSR